MSDGVGYNSTYAKGDNEDALVKAVKGILFCPIWVVGIPECLERNAGAEKSNNRGEELESEEDENGAVDVNEGSAWMASGYASVE